MTIVENILIISFSILATIGIFALMIKIVLSTQKNPYIRNAWMNYDRKPSDKLITDMYGNLYYVDQNIIYKRDLNNEYTAYDKHDERVIDIVLYNHQYLYTISHDMTLHKIDINDMSCVFSQKIKFPNPITVDDNGCVHYYDEWDVIHKLDQNGNEG